MVQGLPPAALFASFLLVSAGAAAEPTTAPPASSPPPTTTAPPATSAQPAKAAEVRRDPRGLKGISPFREAIGRGDSALLRRDFEGALAAYREALAQEPENAFGQYRIGEAQLLKGELHEAQAAFAAGLRAVATKDAALKAKLLFALADLAERQKAYDEAIAKWTEYETFTTPQKEPQKDAHGSSPSVGFVASGAERKRVVEAWKKLSADSAQVKARIEKGVQSADEAVRKSSK
ncbi:MAG TPA: hypothetical protein VFK05_39010 [Polyangiaceae bacterium]|nr:hypothetical protein [Polyangiaceae bacterium]